MGVKPTKWGCESCTATSDTKDEFVHDPDCSYARAERIFGHAVAISEVMREMLPDDIGNTRNWPATWKLTTSCHDIHKACWMPPTP